MTAEQVIDKIRDLVSLSTCDELELYEQLEAEAEGWAMRAQELRAERGCE